MYKIILEISNYRLEFSIMMGKPPVAPIFIGTMAGESGPSWARTSDPLIMSFQSGFPHVYTDLYLFVPV
jgi:hypothetical protein